MHLKTPKFWFKNNDEINPLLYTLKPLSKFWEFLIRFRLKNGLWEKMPIPVMCIGNLTVGGSGKTPVTMSLLKLLEEMGIKACVVSRGYGGKIQRPHYVTKNDTYHKVGDEPLILSKNGSIIVSKNKKDGIIKAYNDGFDLVVLDDGFQNSRIKKDLSLVVVDSQILFGNELIFPLGPLRESIQSGLSRADAIVLIDYNPSVINRKIKKLKRDYKVSFLDGLVNEKKVIGHSSNKKVLAFSGIAFPEKFHNSLKRLKYTIIKTKVFPDHYPFTSKDILKLKKLAESKNLQLITTEKDMVRIPKIFHKFINQIQIEFKFSNPEKLKKLIRKKLS